MLPLKERRRKKKERNRKLGVVKGSIKGVVGCKI